MRPMLKHFNHAPVFVIAAVLSMSLLCGCVSALKVEFETKIANMSDDDLLNYYYGLSDRLNDLDGARDSDPVDRPDPYPGYDSDHDARHFTIPDPGYILFKKIQWVLEELNKRKIRPSRKQKHERAGRKNSQGIG